MKKIFIIIATLAAICLGADAKKMSDLKVYINPGHGGYTSNDRPIKIYPFAQNDTLGFWESKSNLYKGLHMYHILDSLGAKPYLSRTKNTEDDDRSLSGICTEANNLGCDLLFSIHSNAGETENYPLMLYREETLGVPRYELAVRLSQIVWDNLHSSKLSVWTLDKPYVAGDLTFYQHMWQGGLGVLRTLYLPGMLSEGGMHEHQPEAHRLMNDDMWWLEAWHFVKSIMQLYDTDDKFVTGNVAGVVHDSHRLREVVQPAKFTQYGRDRLAALNGAYVELLDLDGTVVQKRTTDNMYNGVFVFRNVAPGKYRLRTTYEGYYPREADVEVKAMEVSYCDMPLDYKREFPLEIIAYDPAVNPGETVSCASTINLTFNSDIDTEAFENAFKITPPVEGYFTYSDSYSKVSFHPSISLAQDTHYTVTVAATAKHPDPYYTQPTLKAPFSFEFNTASRSRVELISQSPANGDEVHYASPTLELRFDSPITSTNIYDIYTVTDSKGNIIEVNKRNTKYNKLTNGYGNIIYALSNDLVPGETYSATLTDELRDHENLPLSAAVSYTFRAIDATAEGADAEVAEDFTGNDLFAYDAEHTTGIGKSTPTYTRSTERLFETHAAKLGYKFTDVHGGDIVWAFKGNVTNYYRGNVLGLHINGDFSDHELLVGLTSGADVKYASLGLLNFRGWRYIEVPLDMLEEGYPYAFTGIRLVQTTSPYTQQGYVGIDHLTRRQGDSGIAAVNASNALAATVADGTINVNAECRSLELISLTGKIIAVTAGNTMQFSAAPGVYILRVTLIDGSVTTMKLAL